MKKTLIDNYSRSIAENVMPETDRIEYKRELHTDVDIEKEVMADRIEITSADTLPEGLSEEDFFDGVSIPRNPELMRVYRDLELVEQLGSGVPRILESYGKECFRFMDNFIRMSFPASERIIYEDGLVDGLVESQRGNSIIKRLFVLFNHFLFKSRRPIG